MKNFSQFNQSILKNKSDHVTDQSGVVRVFSAAINNETTNSIDFDSFTVNDVEFARQTLEESLIDNMDDEVLFMTPCSVIGQVSAIQKKIHALESAPKQRVPSPYRFL